MPKGHFWTVHLITLAAFSVLFLLITSNRKQFKYQNKRKLESELVFWKGETLLIKHDKSVGRRLLGTIHNFYHWYIVEAWCNLSIWPGTSMWSWGKYWALSTDLCLIHQAIMWCRPNSITNQGAVYTWDSARGGSEGTIKLHKQEGSVHVLFNTEHLSLSINSHSWPPEGYLPNPVSQRIFSCASSQEFSTLFLRIHL